MIEFSNPCLDSFSICSLLDFHIDKMIACGVNNIKNFEIVYTLKNT